MKRKTHAWAYIVLILTAAIFMGGCSSSKAWQYTKEKAWPDFKAVAIVHVPSVAMLAIDDILGLIGVPISLLEWGVQGVESVVSPSEGEAAPTVPTPENPSP